jgi:hypothetical protein
MKLTRERTTSGATTFGINVRNSNKGIVSDYADCRHAKCHYADCRQGHIDCSVQRERERANMHYHCIACTISFYTGLTSADGRKLECFK